MGRKSIRNTEWSVLIVCVVLCIFGLVALFSATQSTNNDEFRKQAIFIVVSIPFLILAATIDYNFIVRFSTLFYLILIGLLIGVLFTEPISGASSWFRVTDSLSFQPSEVGKVILVLFLAFVLNKLLLT